MNFCVTSSTFPWAVAARRSSSARLRRQCVLAGRHFRGGVQVAGGGLELVVGVGGLAGRRLLGGGSPRPLGVLAAAACTPAPPLSAWASFTASASDLRAASKSSW